MRLTLAKYMHPCITPIGSVGVFLTALKSIACAMWSSEVTAPGIT
ncbi:MAG: hypothetical protein OFPII_38960 [Osedax symbiont Rs1]|nr:MAG: hypothetical protein OFPII_38960 [Osedax symbiont Rs1]